jgi:hypothetical protein
MKLALAFNISRVEGDLYSGKATPETTWHQKIPGRIEEPHNSMKQKESDQISLKTLIN